MMPHIPVSIAGAVLIVIFGFFFGAVSSRMVGLVGSSNNPISGMAIATLLFATFILKRSLQSRTAATRIEDVDLYKIQMNRKKSTDLISL